MGQIPAQSRASFSADSWRSMQLFTFNRCAQASFLVSCFTMHFRFDIRKAVAAAGYLCQLNGGSFDMLKLLKALYLADRKALVEWQRTITGDEFFSLRHGPILSRVYDLMRWGVRGPEMDAWASVFSPLRDNTVCVRAVVDTDSLSQRDMDALQSAFHEVKELSIGELIERLHGLPEWQDPGDSCRWIDPKTILKAEGLSAQEIAEIEQDLDYLQAAQNAFQAA
jgi:uncharacterized phage-associated protein